MTTLQNELLTNVIHMFGFEHKSTIIFAEMCEKAIDPECLISLYNVLEWAYRRGVSEEVEF